VDEFVVTSSAKISLAFENNPWKSAESRSGVGSSLEQTARIRAEIPSLLKRRGVKSFLDIPCGDFNWMKEIKPELNDILTSYVGGDIVPDIIEQNRARHQSAKFTFQVLDVTRDRLPSAELVMVRDCLIHLGDELIVDALENVRRSGATYILASTYTQPRPHRTVEGILLLGRAVNLCGPPFSLPDPLELINEGCTEQGGAYSDKCLGLWRADEIDVSKLRRRVKLNLALSRGRAFAGRVRRALKRRLPFLRHERS
jgi:SAM-dependent methyltransferase